MRYKINITIPITGYPLCLWHIMSFWPGLPGINDFEYTGHFGCNFFSPFFQCAQVFLLSSISMILFTMKYSFDFYSAFISFDQLRSWYTFGIPQLHPQITWHLNANTFILLCLPGVIKFYINLLITIFLLNIFIFCY